ncbi:uncharacterized protein APUU_60589A [Aspergillus puulaauensis]|uniref:Uncharacterized protein n=1 Tax=Aspergillus puulaauensis TaxID=1220207 RepID=A0A7R7XTN8_9EURO|nr:uncharacterized protein APUU_60589A [Aspergillus puulaauensis]BCS27541.1 hypothetical protein APUU_60589A [Aspergillus puulaauensis]
MPPVTVLGIRACGKELDAINIYALVPSPAFISRTTARAHTPPRRRSSSSATAVRSVSQEEDTSLGKLREKLSWLGKDFFD